MSATSYGALTRRPVFTGKRRVPGLFERMRSDGSVVFEFSGRLGGRMTRRTLEARTKSDAFVELRALQTDFERGELHRSPSFAPTLRELATDYLLDQQARVGDRDPKRRRSQKAVDEAKFKLERYILPTLGHMNVTEVRVADVVRLLDELARWKKWGASAPHTKNEHGRVDKVGLAPSTRTGAMNVLSAVLQFGIRRGVVDHNVVRDVHRDERPGSKRESEPRYLETSEIEALLANVGDTFRPIVLVMVFAGLRISEALALRWRDLDVTAATLAVQHQLGPNGTLLPVKTEASAAVVRLVPRLVREMKAHRSQQATIDLRRVHADSFIFATATGRPQSKRNVHRAITKAGNAAGLNREGLEPVSSHDMRHSFVAQGFEHGLTLPEVSSVARHATPQVTAQVYSGLTEKAREQAAEKLAASGFGA